MQSVRGVVTEVAATSSGFGRVAVLIADGTGHLRGVWYNQPFMDASGSVRECTVLLTATPSEGADVGDVAPSDHACQRRGQDRREVAAGLQSDGEVCRSITCDASKSRQLRSSPISWRRHFPRPPEAVPVTPLVESVRAIHQPADREELERARRALCVPGTIRIAAVLSIRWSGAAAAEGV